MQGIRAAFSQLILRFRSGLVLITKIDIDLLNIMISEICGWQS